ncbi:hypothetical protein sscle_11g083010 [Sclerotinia sclerotiorum 1980 UF-70]|uniref:Clr5 domain-containing protein n=1 Tax=Sclerotinia sclerotiorum (strain ATCC 18683 / 1980 / Ss-1) TaxID=665079 RepID=A0A1D9QF53_SCLS1|nr:hypothetical protein sscle_11g083010 [Sclerotinia sclerotiorum 1980 UF-70]
MANTQQQTPKPPGPKRARDHATITSNKWTDHENLLFQLYVTEKKSYKEVRRIMNEKCKWSASERQYKGKIKLMGIYRNTEERERKAVIKHIQRRREKRKESYVRIRKHQISEDNLRLWEKKLGIDTNGSAMAKSSSSPI